MLKSSVSKFKSSRRRNRNLRFVVGIAAVAALVFTVLSHRFNRTVYAVGDISLNAIGVASTQNFDTLANTGSPSWTDGTTLTGWYAQFGTTSNPTAYTAGTGSSGTGALYSFGSASATDRALGSVASGGTTEINYAVKLTNNTGSTITTLRINFTGEQWRQGGCTPAVCTPLAQTLDFQYQVANAGVITDANTPTTGWTDLNSLDFTTPQPGVKAAAAIDGNAAANRTAKSADLSIVVANGQEVWLRWKDSNDADNDHGVAIDDFSVTPFGGSIGTNGYRTTDIQGTDDAGFAMVLQPDGKIVVGGYAVDPVNGDKEFALVRYNYNGTLDTTFDTDGKVTTDFNGTSDRIWGLALQSDGKIVAAGETVALAPPGTNDIAIARYNTNGSLDTGFSGTGKVTTDHGAGANNSAYGVAIQGTNIIVAGTETVSGNLDFMAARYTSAGVLDPTFGTLGVTTVGFAGGNDVARAVAIDSSSRIILGGYANISSNDDFAIARLTSTGALDLTFAGGIGSVAVDVSGAGNADQAFALGIDGAGRIILAGSSYNGSNKDFAFACYTSVGGLDTAGFGAGTGIKKTDFNNSPDVAQGIYVRSDGSFIAGGFSRYSSSSDDFAVASYNSSGGPDNSFDGDGRLTFRISNDDERIYGIAQEFDGKIVVAGFAAVVGSNPVSRDFAVARFNSNGTVDSTNATDLNNPDLLTTKTGPQNPNSVIAGQNFTYTITVENRGAVAATNVVITDTLPAGVTYVSHVASTGSSNESGGTVTNNVGMLNPDATATLTITVTAGNTPQLVANTATATLTETDLTPGNNSATDYTRIIGLIDLSFSPSTVTGGCQNSTGTVTLSGPAPVGGATVTIQSADPAAASAPPSVVVPQNQTSATFMVTTSPVVSNKQVRFQADLGPTTFVRRLVVNAGVCN